MNLERKQKPHHIARRAGDQGVPHPVSSQAGDGKCATGRNRHLNLRKECKIGTWNVRKMKEAGKLNTICDEMDRNNIKVLGIRETNWNNSNNSGSFKTKNSHSLPLVGKESGYSHGVGIILTKDFANSRLGYHPVNDRIITVRIQAKPHNISTIQFYAPTSTAAEEEMEEFYAKSQETIDRISSRDIKIVMGDANAKVEKAGIKNDAIGT